MALASSHTKVFTRSKGHSATAAAAYRAGEKIVDEQTGKPHDYTRKKGIAYAEIVTPDHAPDWAKNRSTLWNTVEQTETRKNSQLAREVAIALQHELTLAQNIALAREYAQTFAEQGMIVDMSIHYKIGKDGKFHNPHAHLMLTMRELDGDQFSKHKCREWNDWTNVEAWRKEYERLTNSYLERAGSKERICVDSYEKQGIDQVPTVHLGHHAHQLEQAGISSERGDLNRQIAEQNRQLATLEKIRKDIDLDIKYLQAEKRHDKPHTPMPERVEPPPTPAHHNHHTKYKRHTPEELDRLYKEAEQRYTNKPKGHHERRRRERQREDERGLEH